MSEVRRRPPVLETLALLGAAAASLFGGALLAVPCHGFVRLAVAGAGFAGYVGLFARAVWGVGGRVP